MLLLLATGRAVGGPDGGRQPAVVREGQGAAGRRGPVNFQRTHRQLSSPRFPRAFPQYLLLCAAGILFRSSCLWAPRAFPRARSVSAFGVLFCFAPRAPWSRILCGQVSTWRGSSRRLWRPGLPNAMGVLRWKAIPQKRKRELKKPHGTCYFCFFCC